MKSAGDPHKEDLGLPWEYWGPPREGLGISTRTGDPHGEYWGPP